MRTLEDLYIQKYDIINLLKISMEKKNKKKSQIFIYEKCKKKKKTRRRNISTEVRKSLNKLEMQKRKTEIIKNKIKMHIETKIKVRDLQKLRR